MLEAAAIARSFATLAESREALVWTLTAEARERVMEAEDRSAGSSLQRAARSNKAKLHGVGAMEPPFVGPAVMGVCQKRPRATVVIVSLDVPQAAELAFVGALRAEFPGGFVWLAPGARLTDTVALKAVIASGRNVILSAHTGETSAARGAFIADVTAMRDGLEPAPCVVLCLGHRDNRSGARARLSVYGARARGPAVSSATAA